MRMLALGLALSTSSGLFSSVEAKDAQDLLIEGCVKYVHQREGWATFDAYKTGPGDIHMFGTKYGQFEFQKCMAQGGHTLDDAKAP